ncbi:MAG: flagellar biosynthesis anti-sigma factor FlgM [Oscillibacter sp.]|jgi:hypothetical protein|uniref:hypothetical protein n=1 Tax=uncultured Oscillibacter sp. TaxID=876091 RepID=UPI00216B7324|nr:hypothetical protein [uncultured Oscillibacter sp.]MCI8801722.1 flagellar biosynthesis anti-sigma factor FlgM [Oscillibacter sp.]
MLTSSGSGPISSVSRPKTYYTPQKRGAAARTTVEPNYDSAAFSPRPAGKSGFQMELVSRLSHEVRTATTTGDIQELRRAVSAGEYAPDPMAIAGRMMLLTED